MVKISGYAVPKGALYALALIVVAIVGYFGYSALTGGDETESDDLGLSLFEAKGIGLDQLYKQNGQLTDGNFTAEKIGGKYVLIKNTPKTAPTAPVMTQEDIQAAITAALVAQQGGAGVSFGSGSNASNVIAALQSRSGSAITVNRFSTMYTASEDLGMNAPELNFDTEATKVVLLMPGEFAQLIEQSVNKAFTQDDQVSNLKATLKVAFPGTVVPAIGFDIQTDGSSKIYGWEIKADGSYACFVYDGDVSTCTDDSGSADALDVFS